LTVNCARKFSLVGLLLTALWAKADTLQEGNAAFAKGDYPAAIRAFESTLAARGPSAGIYYSLGTAEQKDGQYPRAAANFRRAILLDPRLGDARIALSEIERSHGVSSVPSSWRERVAERAPLKALLVAGSIVAWLGAFLLLFTVFARGGRFLPLAGAMSLVAAGVGLFAVGFLADPRVCEKNVAVVSQKEGAALLSSPADQSPAILRLPGASPVRVLGRSGEWTYCGAPAGERGWIPSKSLEAVVPAA
jgi:tetratricopeptide (TPR) repeat protein